MPWLGPRLWRPDGIREGAVRVDDAGRVELVADEAPGRLAAEGLVVPAPVNAHTHLADHAARGLAEGLSLEAAVAPPDGAKHRFLAESDDPELEASLRRGLEEVHAGGARRAIDFREQGPRGARLARQAVESLTSEVELTVLGRPSTPEAWEDEAPELVDLVDGIGISGLADQPMATSRAQAAWCHEHGKHLALHHSEGEREDLDAALSLDPDLLVHGTFFTQTDAERVADAGIPLVVCARANALFGNQPPVEQLVDAGVRLGLGTDNAMFHVAHVLAEAAHLVTRHDAIDPRDVLEMLCGFHLPGEAPPSLTPGTPILVLDDEDGLDRALAEMRSTTPWRDSVARPQP